LFGSKIALLYEQDPSALDGIAIRKRTLRLLFGQPISVSVNINHWYRAAELEA